MSTSCEVLPGTVEYATVVSTRTVFATAVSTAPAVTVTSSTPVVTSNCLLPTILGDLALCSTSTSFSPVATVVPGSVATVTSSSESLVTLTETRQGADRTACAVVAASPSPSSSSRAETAPTAASSSSPTSTTQPILAASTTVTFATTTITAGPTSSSAPPPSESSPAERASSETSAPDVATTPAPSVVEAAQSSAESPLGRSTSYVTSWVTIIDASGRTMTSAETVPTLLNMPASSSSTNNVGAIAGGVVGGIAALVLVGVVFFLMRKRRGCFGKGDEGIEDDVWDPAPYSGYRRGTAAPRSGGGGGAGPEGGTGVAAAGGATLTDEKAIDDDRRVDAATLERHQSWYKSLDGHGSRELDPSEEAYDGMAERSTSPVAARSLNAHVPQPLPYASTRPPRSSHGPQRSMSNRLSVQSHSSHSHEASMPPAMLPSVPIPDYRLSQLSEFGYRQSMVPPLPPLPSEYVNDDPRLSPPPHSHSPPFERIRSTSPTFHQVGPRAFAPLPPRSDPALARQRSLPALALPVHMRSASYSGPHSARPSLGALQPLPGGSGSTSAGSSASPSRGRTDDSLSSGSGSATSKGRTHSYSMPVLNYSPTSASVATTARSKASSAGHDVDEHGDDREPSLKAPLPTLERLKRPAMARADSDDSLLVPSQWLGARVVNGDAGRSVESLTAP